MSALLVPDPSLLERGRGVPGRVSILIPCYSAQQWIGAAIESALAQTYPDKEVVVVDDGSTDRSVEVIRGFGDRIRWEAGPNRGGNVTRNRLLALASGEWLQYLDADDYLFPGKVEAQMRFAAGHPGAGVIFSPVVMEYWEGEQSRQELLPIPEPHDLWILLARWYLPQTGAPLWRRAAVVQVGGWRPEQPCCQEHELYLRLLMGGQRFVYCPDAGAVYRQWSEGTVCKRNKPQVWEKRLEILGAAERFLAERGEQTAARRWAINQARFETARSAWGVNRKLAEQAIASIRASDAAFEPAGEAAPRSYTWVYRCLGFEAAEQVAAFRRRWKQGAAHG